MKKYIEAVINAIGAKETVKAHNLAVTSAKADTLPVFDDDIDGMMLDIDDLCDNDDYIYEFVNATNEAVLANPHDDNIANFVQFVLYAI